ncbi:MAG: TerB family tellurite resistance protein [Maricaulis sp.]|nr:TerB family tellurite resistance protein [Maricaulis sp.]
MFVFGTKSLKKKLNPGEFDCPQCQQKTQFWERRPRTWGHLYWIPIFPIKTYPSYVECRSCETGFVPSVLDFKPGDSGERFMAKFERTCLNVAAKMALSDGHIDDVERSEIAQMMSDITSTEFSDGLVNNALHDMQKSELTVQELLADIAPSLNDGAREMVLMAVVGVAITDGEFAEPEIEQTRTCGEALLMSKAHVSGIIEEAQAHVHRKKSEIPA